MSVWDLVWTAVAMLGWTVTFLLVLESRRDLKYAPPKLQTLGRQLYRHEVLRLVKQTLLVVAISSVLMRDSWGDLAVITIRSVMMAAVAMLLSINSIWDLAFRVRYFKQIKDRK